NELFGANPDQPDLPVSWVLTLVEERLQQPHGPGVERVLARQVLARRVRAVEGQKVFEAHRDRDGAERSKAVTVDPREDAPDQLPCALEDEAGIERVDLERLLFADGLRLPLVRDLALRDAARFRVQPLAPAAEPFDENGELEVAQLLDRANPLLVEKPLRLGTDPGNSTDRQSVEEALDVLWPHDRQAIGLLEVGGDLGDELVRPDADRAREALDLRDLALEDSSVLGGRFEASQRGEIEVGLVDAGLLERVRTPGQERHDSLGHLMIEGVVVAD